jgi:hypothetical protein
MIVQFLSETLTDSNGFYIGLNAVIALGPAAYSLITGLRLWMLRKNALRQTKVFFIIMGSIQIFSIIILVLMRNTNPKDYTVPIRSIVSIIIWLSYLSKSRRVAETFGLPHADDHQPIRLPDEQKNRVTVVELTGWGCWIQTYGQQQRYVA